MNRCSNCRIDLARFSTCPWCHANLETLKSSTFKLHVDGDYREKEWSAVLTKTFPAYERTWKAHIVPLTHRIFDSKNNLIRHDINPVLIDLVDASYTVMYHFTQCFYYSGAKNKSGYTSTESVYCYFSHAASLMDAIAYFGSAIEGVAAYYAENKIIQVNRDSDDFPACLAPWDDSGNHRVYKNLRSELKRYRNLLVHKRPLFVQKGHIPKVEHVDLWHGLSVRGRLLKDPSKLGECFETAKEVFARNLTKMGIALQSIWRVVESGLDSIWLSNSDYREGQIHVGDDERSSHR